MSKRAELTSTCICGHAITFAIRKPTHFTPSHAKATCMCGSRYLFTCRKDGRAQTISVDADALELSAIAKEIAAKRIRERADA